MSATESMNKLFTQELEGHEYFNEFVDHCIKDAPVKMHWIYEKHDLKMAFWHKGGMYAVCIEFREPFTMKLSECSDAELYDLVRKVEWLVYSLTKTADRVLNA